MIVWQEIFRALSRLGLLLFVVWNLNNCAGGGTDKGGHSRVVRMAPQATIVRSSRYTVLGMGEGESSTLFLLGFIPVTNPLNPEYAMSQAVQKYEGGQSLVDVVYWHETHYYFPLGTVSVFKVEGKVVSFENPEAKGK